VCAETEYSDTTSSGINEHETESYFQSTRDRSDLLLNLKREKTSGFKLNEAISKKRSINEAMLLH
jgi:hypothetical protein